MDNLHHWTKTPVIVLVDDNALQFRSLAEHEHVRYWAVVVAFKTTEFFRQLTVAVANPIGHGKDVFVEQNIFASALRAANAHFLLLAVVDSPEILAPAKLQAGRLCRNLTSGPMKQKCGKSHERNKRNKWIEIVINLGEYANFRTSPEI